MARRNSLPGIPSAMILPQSAGAGRQGQISYGKRIMPYGYTLVQISPDRDSKQIRINLVPRRGTISLAVGETYGSGRQEENSSDPEGVEYSTPSGSEPDFPVSIPVGFTYG
jgi:hypothetical protein